MPWRQHRYRSYRSYVVRSGIKSSSSTWSNSRCLPLIFSIPEWSCCSVRLCYRGRLWWMWSSKCLLCLWVYVVILRSPCMRYETLVDTDVTDVFDVIDMGDVWDSVPLYRNGGGLQYRTLQVHVIRISTARSVSTFFLYTRYLVVQSFRHPTWRIFFLMRRTDFSFAP